jgi:hypothetical protein
MTSRREMLRIGLTGAVLLPVAGHVSARSAEQSDLIGDPLIFDW